MKEITIRYEKMKWTDAPGYPEGSKIKILREGGPEKGKTFLRKIKRGFKMEGHSHTTAEQHFVLQGEYESKGKIYKAGTYRLIPRHKTHGPFKSSTGAVILVIWDPEQEDLAADLEKMKRTAQKLTKKEKIEFLRDVCRWSARIFQIRTSVLTSWMKHGLCRNRYEVKLPAHRAGLTGHLPVKPL